MANDRLWWEREDLCYRENKLHFGGRELTAFAASAGTPTFVYLTARVRDNLQRLRDALSPHCVEHDAFYAIKAIRYAPLARLQHRQDRSAHVAAARQTR